MSASITGASTAHSPSSDRWPLVVRAANIGDVLLPLEKARSTMSILEQVSARGA